MTTENTFTTGPAQANGARSAGRRSTTQAPRSWPWQRGALILAGAAQLITISALVGSDPLAASWAALLLAIAPAPLVAVAAFAPASVARAAAVVAVAVLVVGIIGGIRHTGLFFVPALAVLSVGIVMLWRERRLAGLPVPAPAGRRHIGRA